ncbi:MAG TPA: carboxypeptidase-like regulatory domain-containing protein [Thermoanaerobaculia bacterium]|jgi:hypothetical protein|nr:carboxypeptidase-like regulatory domain-containing protein [Thermoanaerobaculia bacterium]
MNRCGGRLALALCVLPALRCATVYSRGIVRDGAGAPVGGAMVRLLGSGGGTVASTLTDAHGCFFLQRTAPRGEKRFTLEIGADRYKAARLDVPLQPPILLAILVPDSSDGESRIRTTTASERSDVWERQCIPLFAGGGAQSLGPN